MWLKILHGTSATIDLNENSLQLSDCNAASAVPAASPPIPGTTAFSEDNKHWNSRLQLLPGFNVHHIKVGDGLYSHNDRLKGSNFFLTQHFIGVIEFGTSVAHLSPVSLLSWDWNALLPLRRWHSNSQSS